MRAAPGRIKDRRFPQFAAQIGSPTARFERGWIPPIATGVSIAAAHAGAHLARFSAEQTSGGGGGGGPNGRIPPAVTPFEYAPRAE